MPPRFPAGAGEEPAQPAAAAPASSDDVAGEACPASVNCQS